MSCCCWTNLLATAPRVCPSKHTRAFKKADFLPGESENIFDFGSIRKVGQWEKKRKEKKRLPHKHVVDGLPLAWSEVIYDAVNLNKTCSAHRPAQWETHARSTVSIAQPLMEPRPCSVSEPELPSSQTVRWEHFWGDQRNSEVKQLHGKMADKHPAAVHAGKAVWMPGSEMHYWKSGELSSSWGTITCSQSVHSWWKIIWNQGLTCSRVCGDLFFVTFGEQSFWL